MRELTMPMFGLTMDYGTVTGWLKKEGDAVKKGESVLEIETDKMVQEVEAPEDGILLKIVAPIGSEIPVKGLLGYLGAEGESADALPAPAAQEAAEEEAAPAPEAPAAPAEAAPAPTGRLKISPVARKLAAAAGIDPALLRGTGPGGRIIRRDIEAAIAAKPAAAPALAAPAAPAAEPGYDVIPYIGMRKRIGENMVKSQATSPTVTHHVRLDTTALARLRAELNEGAAKEERITVTDLLIFLLSRSLRAFPVLNSSLVGAEIRCWRSVHMGIAAATEKGLVVPVLRDADRKSLAEIRNERRRLVARARAGQLTLEEMSGSTFTLSNLGASGSVDFFTPIINQPEAAILGVGRSVETPVVVNGEICIRSMTGFSLTYDHRMIDGAVAADFMADVMKRLENPLRSIALDVPQEG